MRKAWRALPAPNSSNCTCCMSFAVFGVFAHISSTCVAASSEIPSNVASEFQKEVHGPKHGQPAQTTTFHAF